MFTARYGLNLNAVQDLILVPLCYRTVSSGDMFPMSVTLSRTKIGVTHKLRTGYSHMKPLYVCPVLFIKTEGTSLLRRAF
jgi:hypothetical protein